MAEQTSRLTSLALELASLGADLYGLLGDDLLATATEKEIQRAWRRVGLKYHPDRVGADDASARERYERCRQARDILLDGAARRAYDGAREAEERRRAERERMDGERRAMVEDLERREREAASGGAGARGASARSAATEEQEEKLRRAFERGREMERTRRRAVAEAEDRERARDAEAAKKTLDDLDREESALRARLEEVRARKDKAERKRDRDRDRKMAARKSRAPPTGAVMETRDVPDDRAEEERENYRRRRSLQPPPPPPPGYDPTKKYTLDQLGDTLQRLRNAQEEKIKSGRGTRAAVRIPLDEKTFDMPDGRTIRVPRYSFSHDKTARRRGERSRASDVEAG